MTSSIHYSEGQDYLPPFFSFDIPSLTAAVLNRRAICIVTRARFQNLALSPRPYRRWHEVLESFLPSLSARAGKITYYLMYLHTTETMVDPRFFIDENYRHAMERCLECEDREECELFLQMKEGGQIVVHCPRGIMKMV